MTGRWPTPPADACPTPEPQSLDSVHRMATQSATPPGEGR